jgi:predicted RNA-binding protein with TRAM domain
MRNDQLTGMRTTVVRIAGGGTGASTAIDGANYRFAVFHVMINAASVGKSVTVQIEHSDDNVSFSNIGSVATISGDVALTSGMVLVNHQTAKRYVRAYITPSSSAQTSCLAVQFNEIVTPDATSNVTYAVL